MQQKLATIPNSGGWFYSQRFQDLEICAAWKMPPTRFYEGLTEQDRSYMRQYWNAKNGMTSIETFEQAEEYRRQSGKQG